MAKPSNGANTVRQPRPRELSYAAELRGKRADSWPPTVAQTATSNPRTMVVISYICYILIFLESTFLPTAQLHRLLANNILPLILPPLPLY